MDKLQDTIELLKIYNQEHIIKLLENYKSSILRLDYEENLFNFYIS